MKKIMFLGGDYFQLPPILYAKKKGYEVITCDNRTENPGHALANKHFIVSTIDRDAILEIATREKIDGILTYGSDVSAPTAAYVASKLGLPGNPLQSVETLISKSLFRKFMYDHGYQKTVFAKFSLDEKANALSYARNHKLPFVIKPEDAAGSKGVSIIKIMTEDATAIEYAYKESISKSIIIEEYVAKKGKQVCGDGFMIDGKLVFIDFGDGHFYKDEKHLAPWGETFPSTQDSADLEKAKHQIEKVLKHIGFTRGAFNVDLFITPSGVPFINEIGPRSGGNYIPQATLLNTGVDMIAGCVEVAIDTNYKLPMHTERSKDFFSCYMVHSAEKQGTLAAVEYSPEIQKHIYMDHMYLKVGEPVNPFYKGNDAIGNVILKFSSFEEMQRIYTNIHNHFTIRFQ